jgi:hypothetical protein
MPHPAPNLCQETCHKFGLAPIRSWRLAHGPKGTWGAVRLRRMVEGRKVGERKVSGLAACGGQGSAVALSPSSVVCVSIRGTTFTDTTRVQNGQGGLSSILQGIKLVDVLPDLRLAELLFFRVRGLTNHFGDQGDSAGDLELVERQPLRIEVIDG